LFYTVDTNEDGHLNVDELANMHKLMGRTNKLECAACLARTQLDMDEDGLISAAEFALWSTDIDADDTTRIDEVAKHAFDRVDVDTDGILSLNEIESATAHLAAQGGVCADPSSTQDVIKALSSVNTDADRVTKDDYTKLIRERLVGKKGSKSKYPKRATAEDAVSEITAGSSTVTATVTGRRLRGTF